MKKTTTAEEYLEKIMAGPIKADCPVHRTLELLSGKWRTHIIYELCKHPSMRFGELKKACPHITNTMLTNTLRDLERLGIVSREQFNEIPPHVEYSLTEKGRALLPVFLKYPSGERKIWNNARTQKRRFSKRKGHDCKSHALCLCCAGNVRAVSRTYRAALSASTRSHFSHATPSSSRPI